VPVGQQVEVDDHEQVVERVAAIDVAKASGMVCTRMPHATKAGRRLTRVWQVGSTTNQILDRSYVAWRSWIGVMSWG
jgi:transposase